MAELRMVVPLVVLMSALASAQSQDILTPNWVMKVEVKTDKTSYSVGERVYFTGILTNVGDSVVYVAKTFFERGGGIAGFEMTVKQLSGKRSGKGCVAAGDRGVSTDPRTPKQILQEDFLRLPPGGIVGYRGEYRGCMIAHPGRYQMTATYCACDLNTSVIKASVERPSQIVMGELKSKPWGFRVRDSH